MDPWTTLVTAVDKVSTDIGRASRWYNRASRFVGQERSSEKRYQRNSETVLSSILARIAAYDNQKITRAFADPCQFRNIAFTNDSRGLISNNN